ncbi:MAG: superoxide dismutase [Patescibacteria group bacterium]|nr:superoxide dismutase [Patescibacteria group bacterium]
MYEANNYQKLIGLEDLSEALLKNHFTLYEGYVNHVNRLNDLLVEIEKKGEYESQQFDELNRRFGWEWNGMRLHEFYFGNLTKEPRSIDQSSALYQAIIKEFGSYEFFEKDFRAMGAMRGIGWVALYFDSQNSRLFNVWINEHDAGHLASAELIIIMDVFEHAYMLDYGVKKPDYIEAFFKIINWSEAEKRFADATRNG